MKSQIFVVYQGILHLNPTFYPQNAKFALVCRERLQQFPRVLLQRSKQSLVQTAEIGRARVKIGALAEIFPGENRVAMTPESALQLVKLGHTCVVQSGAGVKAGFSDALYAAAGVQVLPDAAAKLAEQIDLPGLLDRKIDELSWGLVPNDHVIRKPSPVFPRIVPATPPDA